MTYVAIKLSDEFVEAIDQWRVAHGDQRLTRGDVLEYFVAQGLGIELPDFDSRRRPATRAEMEERGKLYCQLYSELKTYAAVAREVGFSVSTVTKVINRHERMSRTTTVRVVSGSVGPVEEDARTYEF